uniref:TGF-beta family profile domain-containing protein n=1 Tax=Panagrolaimus sp. JU765 TaxID=591449 RepID=A0AC34QK03_9BILA
MTMWSVFIVSFILMIEFGNAAHHRRCASCNAKQFEEYKALRQEQILDDLLFKLDLVAKPNVTVDYDNLPPLGRTSAKVKQLIDRTVMERRRAKRSSNYITMEEEYYPSLYETDSEPLPQISFVKSTPNDEYEMAVFKLSSSLSSKLITRATLHAFVRPPITFNEEEAASVRLNIYERFLNGTMGDRIATKFIHVHGNSRPQAVYKVHLDALDVQRWIREKSDGQVGVFVEALLNGQNLAVHPTNANSDSMFLELELLDGSGRGKRAANICTAGTNETKCCLYDLMIDFEKVGWEFVIAPKRYNAYICSGECSSGQMSSTARGTIAQHAKVDFFQCCHPKDYVGITIVYVTNDNHIWVKEVPGMIARKCGCA